MFGGSHVINGVLARLGTEDQDLLRPDLAPMDLEVRERLASANVQIEHVYFLSSGFCSLVTQVRHEIPIEIGIVGREGVVNMPVLLGTDRSPHDAFMQMAGSGQRIEAERLRTAMAASPSLARMLGLVVHVFMMQTASTVLANGRASLTQRLARWLLMAHDRSDDDVLPLTHEFLSMMLGVRRSGVSTGLRELELRRLVTRNRGNIAILDRLGLIAEAGGYYGSAERELNRLFCADHGTLYGSAQSAQLLDPTLPSQNIF